MSDETVILLARHGETLWNQQKRLQGQKDSPLTTAGRAQAAYTNRLLKDVHIDAAYSSPLQRAVDTISIMLKGRAIEPQTTPALMEIALGPWEGILKQETRRSHPGEYDDFWHRPEHFSLPGAETYVQLQGRVVDQLQDIFDRHANQLVLVVTHWIAIKAALAFFQSAPISDIASMPDLENGAMVKLTEKNGKVEIEGIPL